MEGKFPGKRKETMGEDKTREENEEEYGQST